MLRDEIIVEPIAALLTSKPEMRPLKRFGHAAGGDGVGLHLEDYEYQRRGKRNNQPFERGNKGVYT